MGEQTGISWCDHTWSPWYGCTQVSMGATGACVGCYARQISETRMHRVVFGGPGRGAGTRDVRADSAWTDPLRWNRQRGKLLAEFEAADRGLYPNPPLPVFVFPSMCDPFDNHPDLAQPRRRFFDLIRATPNLTWLLLTKRPQNIVKLFTASYRPDHAEPGAGELAADWPRNAAIGCTVVTQEEADRDIPHLLAAKAALRPAFAFLSMEPLLGPVDLMALEVPGGRFDCLHGAWRQISGVHRPDLVAHIDLVITGGETDQGSHKARETPDGAFESLMAQCAAAGVPFHMKQMTKKRPIPPHLQRQEFPHVR